MTVSYDNLFVLRACGVGCISRRGGKRLSLIQMILLAHLKAELEKKGVTAAVIVMVTAQKY